jgi:hypothetical protein
MLGLQTHVAPINSVNNVNLASLSEVKFLNSEYTGNLNFFFSILTDLMRIMTIYVRPKDTRHRSTYEHCQQFKSGFWSLYCRKPFKYVNCKHTLNNDV